MNMTTLNTPLPEDLMKLKWNGQFKLMQKMIDLRLQKDIPAKLKERLELQKEIEKCNPINLSALLDVVETNSEFYMVQF